MYARFWREHSRISQLEDVSSILFLAKARKSSYVKGTF